MQLGRCGKHGRRNPSAPSPYRSSVEYRKRRRAIAERSTRSRSAGWTAIVAAVIVDLFAAAVAVVVAFDAADVAVRDS